MFKYLQLFSIRKKLITGMLLTTLTALLIFGGALILYDLNDYHERRIEDLGTQSRLIGLTIIPALQFNDPVVAVGTLNALEARPTILSSAIYDANGVLFATYTRDDVVEAKAPAKVSNGDLPVNAKSQVIEPDPAPVGDPVRARRQFPASPEAEGYRVEGSRLVLFRPIAYDGELIGTLYIEGRYQLYERLLQYAGIVLGVALLALALSMLLAVRMQKYVSQPILGITSLARKVAEKRDYSLRAEKLTDDEIGYLVDAFNDLLAQVQFGSAALEASNAKLQREIADRRRANEEIHNLNTQLEQRVAERTAELERANQELEAFSYSVSHDLRTPLRAIDGFSQALLEDYHDVLDEIGQDYLRRTRSGAQRMGQLIDDLLKLARVSRAALTHERLDLSALAEMIVSELRAHQPARDVEVRICPGLTGFGDPHLLRIALENLLSNAWKYTGKVANARIELGFSEEGGRICYFVKDNGAGFDMTYAGKLFGAFQRLHEARDYPGTGVGLATVQRIIHRHGGQIWAEAAVDRGATFYFTLPITEDAKYE